MSATEPATPPSTPSARLRRLLQLRPGEARPVALLFGWYFCVIGAAFAARAVRDALFLAHLGADRLPTMYLVTPIVAVIVGPLYARAQLRVRRDVLVLGAPAAAAIAALAARALLGAGDWLYYTLYVGVNVFSGFVIADVWAVASDRFTSRDAKRLFGLVGAGGTTADVVVGVALTALAPAWGAENLLFLVAALCLLAAGLALALRRLPGGGFSAKGPKPAPGPPTAAPGARHLALAGGVAVLSMAVVTLVDFQFKALTAGAFGDDRAGMVRYFGLMSVATGVISIGIQLVATRPALNRLGVVGALALLPVTLGFGELALFLVPGMAVATFLKGADETFRFTVNDAASQLLYLPAPARARVAWKARVDGRWKPVAQLGLGAALVGYRQVFPGEVGPTIALALGVLLVWLVVLGRLRAAWLVSLKETLRTRPPELDAEPSAEEMGILRAGLTSADADVRSAALAALGPHAPRFSDELAALLHDPDPRLRAAAAAAAPAGRLAPALDDADPQVAAAALRALVRLGHPEGLARLRTLAAAAEPAARVAAAHALEGSTQAATHADLLRDSNEAVRAAALSSTVVGSEAGLAAVLHGSVAAAAALGRLGTAEAVRQLLAALPGAPPDLRRACAFALAQARRAAPDLPIDEAAVRAALDVELREAYEAMAAAEGLRPIETAMLPDGTREPPVFLPRAPEGAVALLSKTLRDRQEAARDRAFALLEALFPASSMPTVRNNLVEPDPARRANAVELLDGLLDKALRQRVLPLVDDAPRYERVAAATPLFGLQKRRPSAWIEVLRADPSPWMRECAEWYDAVQRTGGGGAAMLSTVEKVLLLKGVPLFSAVPTDDLAALARIAEEVHVEAKTDVIREGDHGDALFFVVSGRARVHAGGTTLASVGERDVFGEVALLDPGPRAATVTAEDDLVLLCVRRDAFVEVLAGYPQVPLALLRMLARRVRGGG